MKHLEFKTQIEADKKKVWDTMLRPDNVQGVGECKLARIVL